MKAQKKNKPVIQPLRHVRVPQSLLQHGPVDELMKVKAGLTRLTIKTKELRKMLLKKHCQR